MTFDKIRNDPTVRCYIQGADQVLQAIGFTEHSFAHVTMVAKRTGEILEAAGGEARRVELARIAGFLHDIGNLVNRVEHSQSGAVLALGILEKHGFAPEEIVPIISAIGNHDEGTGKPVNDIAAALILADKSDVRRSRVRNREFATFDIHDRVNYSVTHSELLLLPEEKQIRLLLTIDTDISPVLEFFEIFTERMTLCRTAAKKLGMEFKLSINQQYLL